MAGNGSVDLLAGRLLGISCSRELRPYTIYTIRMLQHIQHSSDLNDILLGHETMTTPAFSCVQREETVELTDTLSLGTKHSHGQ